ncbi:Valyl-tRNA synthetase [[Mycoplasma] cavipharyngis]|uniref:valine--tRNA ligase n=1 Tax=[Mycoplasma] cavipharyngis TaxID=92757 RepID=UPI0037040EEE
MNKTNAYQPQIIEANIPTSWKDLAIGKIDSNDQKFFSIVLPPPNVTGILHLGHAWDGTLQDMLIRYHKLNDYQVAWFSGMDHAGIATQTKFEKELKSKKIDKNCLSRNQFNDMIWQWKDSHANTIREQWAKMGFCLSTNYERFTLDQHSIEVVLDSFRVLFQKNLIYQAERLVNWDPQLQTAISDIEIVYKQVDSYIYYVDYLCASDPTIKLTVATTRPETMFADVCLVINPNDQRYLSYLNLEFINPANQEKLKLIVDSYVDPNFATGVMKCTPAHDFNDYQIGLKHHLPLIKCIGLDNKMLENCQEFAGIDKNECRIKLIEKLQKKNLVQIKPYVNNIGYSDRTDVVVEPMLSKQWFLKTSIIAQQTQDLLKQNRQQLQFIPNNYLKQILHYLNNMEDWCISRQLTWGIQIPIFYHKITKEVVNSTIPPDDSGNWVQDLDVLDTWYSSGLWPLITTETYKNENSKLKSFFPTSVLVTGVDILFFWVSRMMMFASVFSQKMPFKKVYLHGLVRDQFNKKMSKSLNNGIDPQQLITKYGADALRLFFIQNTNSGEDLIYHEDKLKNASVFINKFWNAFNFLKHKKIDLTKFDFDLNQLNWSEKWIYSQISELNQKIEHHYQELQFNLISKKITDFVWNDFCNWFIEFIKFIHPKILSNNSQKFIAYIWNYILVLLNPLLPFITEAIYDQIHQSNNQFYCQKIIKPQFYQLKHQWFFELIQTVRNIRNQLKNPNTVWKFSIKATDHKQLVTEIAAVADLFAMIKIEHLTDQVDNKITKNKIAFAIKQYTVEIYCDAHECQSYQSFLKMKINKLEYEVSRSKRILANNDFLNKATSEKISLEKNKLEQYSQELEQFKLILANQE